jgi:hypothetical protein
MEPTGYAPTIAPAIVPPVIATALAFCDDMVPSEPATLVTKAVVAIWVVFVPGVAVTAVVALVALVALVAVAALPVVFWFHVGTAPVNPEYATLVAVDALPPMFKLLAVPVNPVPGPEN